MEKTNKKVFLMNLVFDCTFQMSFQFSELERNQNYVKLIFDWISLPEYPQEVQLASIEQTQTYQHKQTN